ncbi:MAG: hypothetical protein V3573_06640 [Desulfovibrionaceae bacterium]
MTFRTTVTYIVFIMFVGLCGYELLGHVKADAERDIESVRYVRSLDSPEKQQKQTQDFDLDKVLEHTDVNG